MGPRVCHRGLGLQAPGSTSPVPLVHISTQAYGYNRGLPTGQGWILVQTPQRSSAQHNMRAAVRGTLIHLHAPRKPYLTAQTCHSRANTGVHSRDAGDHATWSLWRTTTNTHGQHTWGCPHWRENVQHFQRMSTATTHPCTARHATCTSSHDQSWAPQGNRSALTQSPRGKPNH